MNDDFQEEDNSENIYILIDNRVYDDQKVPTNQMHGGNSSD